MYAVLDTIEKTIVALHSDLKSALWTEARLNARHGSARFVVAHQPETK